MKWKFRALAFIQSKKHDARSPRVFETGGTVGREALTARGDAPCEVL
jgi:hypothetical protein